VGTLRSDISVRLGLITFSVAVQSAVSEDQDAKLNTVCNDGHEPVRVKQTTGCPTCAKEGSLYSFPRGKDNGDGTFTVLTREQVDAAYEVAEDVKKTITLTAHPAAEVTQHTLPGEKVYYLAEGKAASEGYPVLVELVKRRPDIAFCTVFAVRSAPALYRLAVFNDRLALHAIAWPERINEAPTLRSSGYNEALLPMAEQFIDSLLMPFDPATFVDSRKVKLAEALGAAAPVAIVSEGKGDSPLLTLLRSAVEPKAVPKPRAPRRTTTTKAPAKKAAAKVTNIKEKQTA
jgi:non-homologous end joining protein Ku